MDATGLEARVREAVGLLAARHTPRTAKGNGPWTASDEPVSFPSTFIVPEEQPAWGGLDPKAELVALSEETASTKANICDTLAKVLAEGYADNSLDFQFCDDLINVAQGWLIQDLVDDPESFSGFPELFRRIFLAFDAGEFHPPGDPPAVDPADKYTRPQIAEILGDLTSD